MHPDEFYLPLMHTKMISIDCLNHKFQIWRVLLRTSAMPSSSLLLRLLNRCHLQPWWPRNTTTLWIRTKNSLHMVLVTFSDLFSPAIHLLHRFLGHLCKILPGEGRRYRNKEKFIFKKPTSFRQLWYTFDPFFILAGHEPFLCITCVGCYHSDWAIVWIST